MDQAEKLREIMKENNNNNKRRAIAISSGKGGVGKTNIAVNLALLLNKIGKNVLLFDADLGLANVDVLLGLKVNFSLIDVVSHKKQFSDIIIKVKQGFDIIPAGSGIEDMANVDGKTVEFIMSDLERIIKNTDVLLIDTGAGISRKVTSFLKASDEIIVIAMPEPTSITDAYAVIKILTLNYKKENIKFFVNMAKNPDEAVNVYKNINKICKKFLGKGIFDAGYALYDKKLSLSVKRQKALMDDDENSSFSIAMKRLANNLFNENLKVTVNPIRNFFANLFGR